MSLHGPEPLGPQHRLEGFDCGKPALNDWLLRHARQAQGSGSAKTFVVVDDDRVAGYFSLTVGQIDTLDAPERIRKGMGQYPLPVVILARLAVSTTDQGRGIGVGLLQDAIRRTMLIAEHAGIRAMLTHPIDEDATRFYTRFGFIASPLREQELLLLLKDARRWVCCRMGVEPPTNIKNTAHRRRESTPADIRLRMMVYVSCTHAITKSRSTRSVLSWGRALLLASKHARCVGDMTR